MEEEELRKKKIRKLEIEGSKIKFVEKDSNQLMKESLDFQQNDLPLHNSSMDSENIFQGVKAYEDKLVDLYQSFHSVILQEGQKESPK